MECILRSARLSNCRKVLSNCWYRSGLETSHVHRRETCGYGNNPTGRDDRQPSPTGASTYGCSSQTKWQSATLLSSLRYSRAQSRDCLLEDACLPGREPTRKWVVLRGAIHKGRFQPPLWNHRGEPAEGSLNYQYHNVNLTSVPLSRCIGLGPAVLGCAALRCASHALRQACSPTLIANTITLRYELPCNWQC